MMSGPSSGDDDDLSQGRDSVPSAASAESSDNDQEVEENTKRNNDSEESTGTTNRETYEEVEENTRTSSDSENDDMEILKSLCYVLDIKLSSKLDEQDVMPGVLTPECRLRVQGSIRELQDIKNRRFGELQKLGQELMNIWTTNHITLKKGVNMVVVYAVVKAKSSDEIIGEKFLSGSLIRKVKDEIEEVNKKIAAKYLERKKKLKQLMIESQLVAADVDFNPDEIVVNYGAATVGIKEAVKKVKNKVLERRELLLLIDSIKLALDNSWPFHITKDLIDQAREQVKKVKIKSKEAYVAYNGDDISVVLNNFETAADILHHEYTDEQNEHSLEPSTTRAGASFKPESAHLKGVHIPEDTQSGNSATDNFDQWMKDDGKLMLNVSYGVQNLSKAVEFYTKGIGMKILSRVGTGKNCTEICLGFGSEPANLSLHMHPGDSDQSSGLVKVAVSNVLKVVGKIKPLPGCGVIHEPKTFREGAYIVCHAHDMNGNLFELVERRKNSNIICGMIIYVTNLDTSITFYVKVLGMKVIKQQCDSCTLGYDSEDPKAALLELRVNVEKIKGRAYKLNIQTDDIVTTIMATEVRCEKFGGELKDYGDLLYTRDSISVFDPDGWEIVLVDRAVSGGKADTQTRRST